MIDDSFDLTNLDGVGTDFLRSAIDHFTQALAVKPNDAEAYFYRGTTYLLLEDFARAIDDLSKAIKLDPRNDEAFRNRATAEPAGAMDSTRHFAGCKKAADG